MCIRDRLSRPRALVLRDYHAENLIWLPHRRGIKRVGLIDFQDALLGSPAYDLASLLEDARRDIDPLFADAMLQRYKAAASALDDFDPNQLDREYAILAAQRNAKILGIFARLAKRDGKDRYLTLLPRAERLFRQDLKRPALNPVADFMKRQFPDFDL